MSFFNTTKEEYMNNSFSCLIPQQEEFIDIEYKITYFIKGYFSFYGFRKAIIGISGGIDSAVTAYLTQKALGENNVYGVILPSKYTSGEHLSFALHVCKDLNIEHNDYDVVKEYFDDVLDLLQNMGERESDENKQKVKAGNIQSRIRMIILRDIAKKYNGLVVGTTNKTEMLLGYSTLAGDGLGGVDIEPLLSLYKTSLKKVAEYLSIPEEIIIQSPSAELWEGQTDEKELGLPYKLIDQILLGLELNIKHEDILKALKNDIDLEDILNLEQLIKKVSYKNKMCPTINF